MCIRDSNPVNPEAFAFMGFSHYALGQYEDAAWNFRHCQELRFAWPLTVPWRYLATIKAGRDGSKLLTREIEQLGIDVWPMPLLRALASRDPALKAKPTAAPALDAEQSRQLEFFVHELTKKNLRDAQRKQQAKSMIEGFNENRKTVQVESVLLGL